MSIADKDVGDGGMAMDKKPPLATMLSKNLRRQVQPDLLLCLLLSPASVSFSFQSFSQSLGEACGGERQRDLV
jgi:hypothetical protein